MNKTIKFNGINRNTSITNNADGNCLEVFNLRAKGGRFEVVGTKKPDISSNGHYQTNENWCYNLAQTESAYGVTAKIIKYHQHKVGDSINNIFQVLRRGGKDYTDNIIGVWVKDVTSIDCSTDNVVILWTKEISKNNLTLANGLNIDIESVGNFLTFNLPSVTTFLYQDGEYKQTSEKTIAKADDGIDFEVLSRFSAVGPSTDYGRDKGKGVTLGNLSAGFNHSTYFRCFNSHYPVPNDSFCTQDEDSENLPINFCNLSFDATCNDEVAETMGGQYESMQNETTDYREGFVFVCAAYEMFDGTITKPTTPFLMHLGTTGVAKSFDNEITLGDTIKHYDADTADSYYNPDKVMIYRFHANGGITNNHSNKDNVSFELSYKLRRQRQQSIVFKRPTMPTDVGDEYSKIVYFVSNPISMYDFSSLKLENLHINIKAGCASSSRLDNQVAEYAYHKGEGNKLVRISLGNKMTTTTIDGMECGLDYLISELNEGLPLHIPTAEELENLIFYKAVEFSINDDTDKGDLYYKSETEGFYGKAVNFRNLVNGDILEATTDSIERFEAEGLLIFNKRLHLYGVTSNFSNEISTNYDSVQTNNIVKFSDLIRTDIITCDDWVANSRLSRAVYNDYTEAYPIDLLYKKVDHVIYNLKINNILYKYVQRYSGVSPITTFPDSRLKSVDYYYKEDGKYYKMNVNSIVSASLNISFVDFLILKRLGMENYYRDISPIEITETEYKKYEDVYGTWITDNTVNYKTRLKVSEQSNPISWPVELDYQFDDDIVALGSNHKEISLAQEGQYPTYVFTKKGIWAMGLGTSAFYATQIPINPDVAVSRSTVGIGNGVVYVAKDGIKVLSGRQEQIISLPLDHLTTSDTRLLGNTSLKSALNQTKLNYMYRDCYNYGTPVQSEAKELYNENCIIGFDRKNNELLFYLCNESDTYQTTQVFSLESKMWSEREEWWWSFYRDYGVRKDYWKYYRSSEGAALVGNIQGGVVNLTEELTNHEIKRYQSSSIYTPMEVCLITKPLSLGALDFKQIYHACLRGEIRLPNDPVLGTDYHNENGPHFGFYVFASNDGGDWKMVGGKCFQESVSQVVLERIKQSYRYVAFMLAGEVYDGDSSFNVTHIDLDGIEKYNTRQR